MALSYMLMVPSKMSMLDKHNISTVELMSNSHLFERKYGEWVSTVRRLNTKPLLTVTRTATQFLGLK